MGFWNVDAKDLKPGDEIRATVMGGEEYLTVREVKPKDGKVLLRLEWGSHVPIDPFWDTLPNGKKLTVRR
jgi:hypothetical protein